jgi:3',5'-cyclic AMP phosphodiesterase CpdA
MTFSFVQISDHHLGETKDHLMYGFSTTYAFRAVMRHIATHVADDVDFIVSTGDLVREPTPAAYESARRLLNLEVRPDSAAPGPQLVSLEGLTDVPMYFLPGNHDDRDNFFRYLFPQTSPRPWMNVTFQHQGVQFICLDWGAQDQAVLKPEMLDWLSDLLQSDQPALVLTHHHVSPLNVRWLDNFIAADIERFWDVVRDRNVLGVLCGHAHITYHDLVHGIPVLGVRATAYQFARQDTPLHVLAPPHYRLATVRQGRLTSRIFEVPL